MRHRKTAADRVDRSTPEPNQERFKDKHVAIKAEYIWIDGTEPTPQLRSKTKILDEPLDTRASCRDKRLPDLGIRRLVDQSGHGRQE